MSTLHHPSSPFPLDPQSEANELRDVGASDLSPTLGSPVTWDDVDRMWAAEMERRDRQASCPAGYRDAACEACVSAVFVPEGRHDEVLCDRCRAAGEAAATAEEGDDDPRPPASGALHPDYAEFAASAARMLDDDLCAVLGIADAEPTLLKLDCPQRQVFVAAVAAEVVQRFEGRRAA